MTKNQRKKSVSSGGPERTTYFLSLLVLFLFVSQIVLGNSLTSRGREINQLEREKEDLNLNQVALTNVLAGLGSLERIRSDAAKLGMVEGTDNFDYLVPPKFAFNP